MMKTRRTADIISRFHVWLFDFIFFTVFNKKFVFHFVFNGITGTARMAPRIKHEAIEHLPYHKIIIYRRIDCE